MKLLAVFAAPLLLVMLFCSGLSAENPWYSQFTPKKTIEVSTLQGLVQAFKSAKPGNLYLIKQGHYKLERPTQLLKDGEPSEPVVFRAEKGKRVTIEGIVKIAAKHTWFWGIEFTDPASSSSPQGYSGNVMLDAEGTRLINCVIHDSSSNASQNAVTAWSRGQGIVIYGNIFYQSRHLLYSQNDYDKDGWKYIVGNMFFDRSGA